MAENLVDKVFSFLSGDDLSDKTQSILKQLGKDLNQNKFAKYFRVKTEEIDPSFLSFMYSAYKLTYPIKAFMVNESKMDKLKLIIIESFMDGSILETVNKLAPAAIEAKAKVTAPDELVAQIQADLDKLISQFDRGKINAADRCYTMVAALNQFVNFGFYGFFKKIDPHFVEESFGEDPKFPPVKSVFIVKELAEFLAVTQALRPEDDWKNLLGLLKICAGQELVKPELFEELVKNFREIHVSKIIEMLIQYSLKNPIWQWKARVPVEQIGDDWLEEKKAEANLCIYQINTAQRNIQINALTQQIFEAADLVRLENYTMQHGDIYRNKGLEDFVYARGLNYLKAFLEDYLDKEIKELCDILLVRGQWTNNIMSMDMSEALHQLIDIGGSISALDETMSEDGSDGSRLRAAVMRVDRDKTQARYIKSIIGSNNEEALDLINQAAQFFIVLGKHLKSLIEDIKKKHPELLINWRELNLASKEPMAQRMTEDYKKINYFIQLMTLCTE
ncbi:MAG: DUF5312 family protein [Treponema sp.]|nr:DUF5312 family protein [Treponema sp.]